MPTATFFVSVDIKRKYMPSVVTQTAFKDVLSTATLGSPRLPNSSSEHWSILQPPSWRSGICTRRSGMHKKEYPWFLKHAYSQTEGGMYNAAAWEISAVGNEE